MSIHRPKAATMTSRAKRKYDAILRPDSINIAQPHLDREELLKKIEETAREKQYVIISGAPGTGKSSLLELLKSKVEEGGDEVFPTDIVNTPAAPRQMLARLADYGITSDRNMTIEAFRNRKGLWLLIDEAQNGYSPEFGPMWSFLFKTVAKYCLEGKLFVVVASTYDETLGVSPVHFKSHDHFSPHITEEEVRMLYQLHTKDWNTTSDWNIFRDNLLGLSWIANSGNGDNSRFHIGVVIAGIYLLQSNFKQASFTEDNALRRLRSASMIENLERCFMKPRDLSEPLKAAITAHLIGGIKLDPIPSSDPAYLFVRRGLLNEYGGFSCLAANWFYNYHFFPGRAIHPPASLEDLVIRAVSSMSQLRLEQSMDQGNFSKEAVFQQHFNEAMSKLLPAKYSVLPEMSTKATKNGILVSGELDFYVDSELKWSIELLREGHGIGEHLARFHPTEGKYREVDTNEYLMVDLRGPRVNYHDIQEISNRCTFFFEEGFRSCTYKMRNKLERTLKLNP